MKSCSLLRLFREGLGAFRDGEEMGLRADEERAVRDDRRDLFLFLFQVLYLILF